MIAYYYLLKIYYEFKWNNKKINPPKTFTANYDTDVKLICRENFREFVKI